MNNTIVMVLASLGGLLWLYAVLRERYKNSTGGTFFEWLKKVFVSEIKIVAEAQDGPSVESSGAVSIESLERELGIEPDAYLCDRITRINEALIARRDKSAPKKKGGAS